jgi:hypothetical protein
MSGSFVHKIIIAGCTCFASPIPSGPHQEVQMRIAQEPDGPKKRRYRGLALLVLVTTVLVVILALITQLTPPTSGGASPATTISREPESSAVPTSTIGTRDEVVARLREIFKVRDQAILTRNPILLEEIYTIDCPCLEGDRQLIQKLIHDRLKWKGVEVSLDIRNVAQVNDRLWTINALSRLARSSVCNWR